MHDGHAAEVEQFGGDGGFLGGDDDAGGEVALLADDGEEGVGEGGGGGGVGHELGRMLAGTDSQVSMFLGGKWLTL